MLHKDTYEFLKKLKRNNNREWFEKNKELFLAAKENVDEVVNELIHAIRTFDKRIEADLTAKDCVFRIYRDTRFSKDKTPYKPNMGASINPGGRKSMVPGYYVHFEPGGTFLAGGMYAPEAPKLSAIRQEIDYNLDEFEKILSDKTFKKNFGKIWDEEKLKTAPKGYAKDHPALSHLQHKHYIVIHNLKDADALAKNFVRNAASVFKSMMPFNAFLVRATD